MIFYLTLSKYLAKGFLWYLSLVFLALFAILFVSGAFDILQKFKFVYLNPKDFWLLILFKIPFLLAEISTILVFISALLFLRYLIFTNQLVVIISSGISIWRVFAIPLLISFFVGVVVSGVLNPLAVMSLKKYDRIDARVNNEPQNKVVVSESGIFFYEKHQNKNRIIQAKSVFPEDYRLQEVTILILDSANQLIERIDAKKAFLVDGIFDLYSASIFTKGQTSYLDEMTLATNLSISSLIQRFIPPEMFSVWDLPDVIEKMSVSGMPIIAYELQFYKQFFKPLAMVAMVFLAFWFVDLNIRSNKTFKTTAVTLLTGFVGYFFLEISSRILAYGGVSSVYAVLLPIIFVILISNFIILHLQGV